MTLQERLAITAEIADFFYAEASLLDERNFQAWLDLLHDDIVYFMPMCRNVKFGQHAAKENTVLGNDISWFDEGKWTLTKRVEQILTGVHYAEEPLSRTTHLISNVRVLDVRKDEDNQLLISTSCHFIMYLNRVEYEVNLLAGKRYDTLIATGDSYQVLKREIILDQNVLLVKNLTTFF
ncbi:3-phenylpropionate/cinnamic acid dioxygenase subunit beta [Escherichia fergusonii]|nr:3-phenylpropionate/cinnamic acid dioxygenase subunit beta [Escherichia fergusonii]EHG5992450.1 3-phenylpropionate/cinnamic acid dioxygenase subunit beta [Escherichia fergusonii]